MNFILRWILYLVAAFFLLTPAISAEQSQKASRTSQEDRVKKLEERADAAEKQASEAAMEKDYIARTQRMYETYYQKTFNTQMLSLGIVGFLLIAVFGLVAKFSLDTFEQRTKLATADATAQLRNEYGRILAKEVQKLWDSNAADNKKLKEALTTQSEQLVQNLKDISDFQIHFVQALSSRSDGRHEESLSTFRQALAAYKTGKPRNVIDPKLGATTVRQVFESLGKVHGDNWTDKAREELAAPLYNGLEEELALTALQAPWLTPLINERVPPAPEPPPTPPVAEPRPAVAKIVDSEADLSLGEEYDSCRLITT